MEKQFIGIDVSHQKLDIAWQQAGKWHHQQVVNDAESIAAWRDDLVANAASKEGAEKSATD